MNNNFYEQFFSKQKAMFEEWQKRMKDEWDKHTKNAANKSAKEEPAASNQPDYGKFIQASQDFWKKGFEEWQKQMQSAGPSGMQEAWKKGFEEWQKQMQSASQFPGIQMPSGMNGNVNFNPVDYYNVDYYKNMTSTAQDFWKKTGESQKTYSALVDLWRQLAEKSATLDAKGTMEAYEKWSRQYADLFRANLTPNVPGYMKEFSEKLMDYFALTGKTAQENIKAWMSGGEDLQQAMQKAMAGNPSAYFEFMDVLKRNYEETFGRMAQYPTVGKDMEFWRRHRDSFDRFVKYNIAAAGFYAAMYDVIRESTNKVLEEYATMIAGGEEPHTFEEFYKNWSKQVSATYDKALFSEQYSQLAGNMVNEMSKFKIAYDELCESYMANLPVIKKSDLNALYKTVYELKKELRSLQKENKDNEKRDN